MREMILLVLGIVLLICLTPPVRPVGDLGDGLILFILKFAGTPISGCKIEVYSIDDEAYYVAVITNEKGEAETYLKYGTYKYRTVFNGIVKEHNFTYQGYTIIRVNFEKPKLGLHVLIKIIIAVIIGIVALVGIKKVAKR